jgi:hypothetical protein
MVPNGYHRIVLHTTGHAGASALAAQTSRSAEMVLNKVIPEQGFPETNDRLCCCPEPAPPACVGLPKEFPMSRISVMASAIAIAMVVVPVGSFAQSGGGAGGGSAGGAASGPSAGGGSAVGSPSAGSAGAGTAGVSGVPSGPASAGGLNNSLNDPSGAGNSGKVVSQPPPGTNSAGTANSSGSSAAGSSMTTGSAGSRAGVGGTASTGPQAPGDIANVEKENKKVDRKIKSICRGC